MAELRIALSRVPLFEMSRCPLLEPFADFLLSSSLLSLHFVPVVDLLYSMEFFGFRAEFLTLMTQQLQLPEILWEDTSIDEKDDFFNAKMQEIIGSVSMNSSVFIKLSYILGKTANPSGSLQETIWKLLLERITHTSFPLNVLETGFLFVEAFDSGKTIIKMGENTSMTLPETLDPFLHAILTYISYPDLNVRQHVQNWKAVTIMKVLNDPFERDICSLMSLITSEPSWRLSSRHFRHSYAHILSRLECWTQSYTSALVQQFVRCLIAETCTKGNPLIASPFVCKFSKGSVFLNDATVSWTIIRRFLSSSMPMVTETDQISTWRESDLISRLLCMYIKKSSSSSIGSSMI